MNRSFVAATFTAASALVLVGCSGSSTADAPPSPTVSTATTQQYASVIAPFALEVKALSTDLKGCTPQELACKLTALDANFTADQLLTQYRFNFEPTTAGKKYLGAPPAEISPLVDETKAAAESVLADCESDKTSVSAMAFATCTVSVDSLVSALTRWQPYGG